MAWRWQNYSRGLISGLSFHGGRRPVALAVRRHKEAIKAHAYASVLQAAS